MPSTVGARNGEAGGAHLEQSGEQVLAAPREVVWRALNDAQVLAQCLDGCEAMDEVEEGQFDATVIAKVGPVKATFEAKIELQDIVAPESYRMAVSVQAGAAGHASGTAAVNLTEVDEGTRLTYDVEGAIGGKLAQIGSRLVMAAARKTADKFFTKFNEYVASM